MARPKRPAPSSRVFWAFGIAAAIGAAVFAVFWATGRRERPEVRSSKSEVGSGKSEVGSPAPEAHRGGTLRVVTSRDAAGAVAALTQATLVRINPSTDRIEPWVAESWSAASDNLTYTVKLRPNILWSTGAPLVAEDVALALEGARAPTLMGKPITVKASSPLALEIRFPMAFAPGLRLLAMTPIVNAKDPAAGLGPFVQAPGPGAVLLFERNAHYWRTSPLSDDGKALPYLDRIELQQSTDYAQTLKRLLDGDVDLMEGELRPEDFTALKRGDQQDKLRLFNMGPGLGTDVLWPGSSVSEQVRLAMSTAINRRDYCDAVYLGACDPVAGAVTPGSRTWFTPDLPMPGPDAKLARAMLAGAGIDASRPLRLAVSISRSSPFAARGAAFLTEQLKKVAIAIDVVPVDEATLADRRRRGNAAFGRFELRDSDPAMNLDLWIRPDQGVEWQRRANQLMLEQAATPSGGDRAQRIQLFADAQKIYAEHMPEIYLGAPHGYVATSLRVLNVRLSGQPPAVLWNADQLAVTGSRQGR